MAKGKKFGGRVKGTPNKATQQNRELIEKTLGASPLEKMSRLAKELLEEKTKLFKPMVVDKELRTVRDRGYELRLASDLLSEVAQYHSAKRKAVEITGEEGGPIEMAVSIYLPSNGRDRPQLARTR